MLTSEERERIRRAYYIEHQSVRYISVEQGHSRDTINRIIAENPPASSRRTRRKPAPVFGPFLPRIDALMERNEQLPPKQRYTAHKIFEAISSEGYQGCESRVRQYVASWKRVHQAPDVFLPLEFEPGQEAQCDWGKPLLSLVVCDKRCRSLSCASVTPARRS